MGTADAGSNPADGAAARLAAGRRNLRIARRAFWITILMLFAGVVGLSWLASRAPAPEPRTAETPAPEPLELPRTRIEQWVREARSEAAVAAEGGVEDALDRIFAPVHEAVPAYADFHYSLVGEYTVLAGAALDAFRGRIGEGLEGRLFAGFDARLEAELAGLDRRFDETYRAALAGRVENAGGTGRPLAEATSMALDDALGRAAAGKPVALVAATAGGAVGLRAAAAAMAVRIAARTAAKAAGKTAARAGGIGGGAATGAAVGAFLGPVGAVAGGVIGAVGSWLAVDLAVIKLDELWNRDDFEAELAALVNEQRAATRAAMLAAIRAKSDDTARGGMTIREATGAD